MKLAVRVVGLWLRFWDEGSRVQGFGFRFQGLRFRLQTLGLRVEGLGC